MFKIYQNPSLYLPKVRSERLDPNLNDNSEVLSESFIGLTCFVLSENIALEEDISDDSVRGTLLPRAASLGLVLWFTG